MKKFIKTYLLKSWKTTLAGVVIVVITYLQQTGKISTDTAALITGLLVSLGFITSKDANATGRNATTPPADGRPDRPGKP